MGKPTVKEAADGANSTSIEKEGCYFKKITMEVPADEPGKPNNTITLFEKGQEGKSQKIYFISKEQGQEVLVKTERENEDKCKDKAAHEQFQLDEAFTKTDEKFPIPCEPISAAPWDPGFLKFFFLPKSYGDKHILLFTSCRGTRTFSVTTFPDIEYSVSIGRNLGGLEATKPIKGESDRDDVEASGGSLEFKFGAKYSSGREANRSVTKEFQYTRGGLRPKSPEVESQLSSIIGLVNILKACSNAKKLLDMFGDTKTLASPLSFSMDLPNLSVELGWKYMVSKDYSEIGHKLELTFKSDPLIGLKAKLDILQLIFNFLSPPVAQAVTYLRKALSGERSKDNYLEMYFNVEFGGSLSASAGPLTYKSVDDGEEDELPFTASGKIAVEISLGLKGKFSAAWVSGVVETSAKGAASVTSSLSLVIKRTGLYFRPSLMFDGIKISSVFKAEVGLGYKKKSDDSLSPGETLEREIVPPQDLLKLFTDRDLKKEPYEMVKFRN